MTRYSVGGSENEYMDQAKTVLKNKKNIRDLPTLYLEEEKALARAYELLCEALGHIQGEFLAIHPFREGNARTIKLVTNLLAVQTGRLPLVYDASESGRNQYIDAAKAAILKNFAPMIFVIEKALMASKRPSLFLPDIHSSSSP